LTKKINYLVKLNSMLYSHGGCDVHVELSYLINVTNVIEISYPNMTHITIMFFLWFSNKIENII
jgi:hypothetical protein